MIEVRVVVQNPPGGRCSLYTDFAQALEKFAAAKFTKEVSTTRDANGNGFPAIWINGSVIKPSDGVIVMQEDLIASLTSIGFNISDELSNALDAAVNKMLGE